MSLGNLSETLKLQLFHRRDTQGTQNQPSCSNDLALLNKVLDNHRISNPFEDIPRKVREDFDKGCPNYRDGAKWKQGLHHKKNLFYRIENLSSFTDRHSGLFLRKRRKGLASAISNIGINSVAQNFNKLKKNYSLEKNWLNLDEWVSTFFCYRGFSWWTNSFDSSKIDHTKTSDLLSSTSDSGWLLDFAFNVGYASDWLGDYLLFLELDMNKANINDLKVPSAIDAYHQSIFLPRLENADLCHGLALNLHGEDPKPEWKEYVIYNVPVNAIRFIPMKISTSELDEINPFARINERLANKLLHIEDIP